MLIVGGISGFFVHALTMKISFKQRTIDNKIRVYDAIITQWVKMRNFVYHVLLSNPDKIYEFDKMYGESQAFIGEAILVSADDELTDKINELNERMYRTDWIAQNKEDNGLNRANESMKVIKKDAMKIIKKMRYDIKNSTRFELTDFIHIFRGILPTNINIFRSIYSFFRGVYSYFQRRFANQKVGKSDTK
jgi:hypothetical protein